MRAPISVIIPTLNAEDGLAGCLASLMEGVQAGLIRELIVTDGGSTDATCTLAQDAGAHVITGAPSRGGQLRRGCKVAKGEWLLILHADTELTAGWSEPVLAHLQRDTAAYFKLGFRAHGIMSKLFAAGANLRSRLFTLPYGDQGLLLQKKLYQSVGGYPDQPLMEDVAIVCALRGRLHRLPAHAMTSAHRYQQQGWVRSGASNFWTLARYFCGADPRKLAAAYRK